MTTSNRTLIAVLVLLIGAGVLITGSIKNDAGMQTTGTAMMTTVLGYTFGDRNGEKRLANALTVLQAESAGDSADVQKDETAGG